MNLRESPSPKRYFDVLIVVTAPVKLLGTSQAFVVIMRDISCKNCNIPLLLVAFGAILHQ